MTHDEVVALIRALSQIAEAIGKVCLVLWVIAIVRFFKD